MPIADHTACSSTSAKNEESQLIYLWRGCSLASSCSNEVTTRKLYRTLSMFCDLIQNIMYVWLTV